MTKIRDKNLASLDRRHFEDLNKKAKKKLTKKELMFLNLGMSLISEAVPKEVRRG